MPETGIILELCKLNINANELLSGKKIWKKHAINEQKKNLTKSE